MKFKDIGGHNFGRLKVNIKENSSSNLLKPTGHMMHQQFNIQQLYVPPTLYLCFVFI